MAAVIDDPDRWRALRAERDQIGTFEPVMQHSFSEGAVPVFGIEGDDAFEFMDAFVGCNLFEPFFPPPYRRVKGLPVLWRDVSPFFVYRLARGGKMIGYDFASGARKDSTLLRVNRFVGADGGLPKGWPGSPERMVERINAYRAQALAEDPNSKAGAA